MEGRGRRGRRQARVLLLTGLLLAGAFVALLIAEPSMMEPGHRLIESPITWIGLGILAVGLGWMFRIDRATRDPERHASFWRSRR